MLYMLVFYCPVSQLNYAAGHTQQPGLANCPVGQV